jgi:hypothetical protein
MASSAILRSSLRCSAGQNSPLHLLISAAEERMVGINTSLSESRSQRGSGVSPPPSRRRPPTNACWNVIPSSRLILNQNSLRASRFARQRQPIRRMTGYGSWLGRVQLPPLNHALQTKGRKVLLNAHHSRATAAARPIEHAVRSDETCHHRSSPLRVAVIR